MELIQREQQPAHQGGLPDHLRKGSERVKKTANGYLLEHSANHPKADLHGFVLQHRLVMERYLGRFLTDSEVVHHLRGKCDNRPEDLALYQSNTEHLRTHAKRNDPALIARVRECAANPKLTHADTGVSPALVRYICKRHSIHWVTAAKTHLTGDRVAEVAAREPNIKKAAQTLGVSAAHLYLEFSHLFQKRVPPFFLDEHRGEICRLSMTMQGDQIARRFQTTRTSMTQAFHRWSAAGVLPTALVDKLNADGRRKKKLRRNASLTA